MNRNYSYRSAPTLSKFAKDNTFIRSITGPFGSGKSSACCIEIYRRALAQEPDRTGVRRTRWALVRNSYPQLYDTSVPTFLYWLGHLGEEVVSRHDFHMNRVVPTDGIPVEATIHFRALDKPEDIRNLLSLELTGAFFNEWREIPKRILDAMRGRVGRFPPKEKDEQGNVVFAGATWSGIWGDTNAPDVDHWFYRLFEEEMPHFCNICRTPTGQYIMYPGRTQDGMLIPLAERKCPQCSKGIENASPITKVFHQPSGFSKDAENVDNLPSNYYQNLAAGQDQDFINVYCHGLYGYVKEGKPVYANYDPAWHYSPDILQPVRNIPVIIAFDNTGLTQAAIALQYMPSGQLRMIHEWLVENMGTRRLCRELVHPYVSSHYAGMTLFLTGDPAGVKRSDTDERNTFQEIQDAFKMVPSPARSNAWQARFNAVDTFLKTRLGGNQPGLLVSNDCKLTHRGFMGEYRMRRLQVVGKDQFLNRPEKNLVANLHDALQYGAMLTEDLPGMARKDDWGEDEDTKNIIRPPQWNAFV
jgi:hypothetical protein